VTDRPKTEAGVVDEWELCDTCRDEKRERGLRWCKRCIDEMRPYADSLDANGASGRLSNWWCAAPFLSEPSSLETTELWTTGDKAPAQGGG